MFQGDWTLIGVDTSEVLTDALPRPLSLAVGEWERGGGVSEESSFTVGDGKLWEEVGGIIGGIAAGSAGDAAWCSLCVLWVDGVPRLTGSMQYRIGLGEWVHHEASLRRLGCSGGHSNWCFQDHQAIMRLDSGLVKLVTRSREVPRTVKAAFSRCKSAVGRVGFWKATRAWTTVSEWTSVYKT